MEKYHLCKQVKGSLQFVFESMTILNHVNLPQSYLGRIGGRRGDFISPPPQKVKYNLPLSRRLLSSALTCRCINVQPEGSRGRGCPGHMWSI